MGHYLSEMEGDGELTREQRKSIDRFALVTQREKVLREARARGMMVALEHLVRYSPLPIDFEFARRYLGVDGRDPESAALSEAINRMLAERILHLTGDHHLVWID